ncbi:MAG: hypothetical protein P8186_15465 [Anaerolineae bacterium]|jgi:hypothetical protein
MSGFALISDTQEHIATQDQTFVAFRESVAHHKHLNSICHESSGLQCAAVKFDTSSTLHRGIAVDAQTGSWLLAVGTVMDSGNNPADGNLQPLLTAYLKLGNTALQDLDGPFALVVYDKPANKLAVVSDPLGFISVFYARRGNKIYVATSALAVAEAVQATPSEYGTYLFLTTGMVLGKATLWQEVERLLPGTVLEITPAGSTESVYWSPTVSGEITKLSLNESVSYAFDVLSRLVKDYLEREGKCWADLTGGFDSRLVTMLMDHWGLPFRVSCQGPVTSPDVRISSDIAQSLGWHYQHNMLPDDWGRKRYEGLSRALGKGDGHVDLFKLTRVLWDQDQRAPEYGTSIWGLGGELWRGTVWKQEFWNVGRTPSVNYDRLVDYRLMSSIEQAVFSDAGRVGWIREEIKSLLKSIGDRYADWPNTVKLDCILAYKTTGHTGSHISAVTGLQRAIAPLYFKDSVTAAISTHFRWRNHSRLVRLLMEKVNPALADVQTTDGGPATPMRVTNLHKFIPYWSLVGRQLVRKTSRALLGRSLLPQGRDEFASHPLTQWRQITLDYVEQEHILNHAQMHSGRLYDAEGLARFLERARTEEFGQETFLSRILTLEMALRSVGASF